MDKERKKGAEEENQGRNSESPKGGVGRDGTGKKSRRQQSIFKTEP